MSLLEKVVTWVGLARQMNNVQLGLRNSWDLTVLL